MRQTRGFDEESSATLSHSGRGEGGERKGEEGEEGGGGGRKDGVMWLTGSLEKEGGKGRGRRGEEGWGDVVDREFGEGRWEVGTVKKSEIKEEG